MAAASRPRPPQGSKTRSAGPALSVLVAYDSVRDWLVPGIAGGIIVIAAGLTTTGLVPTADGLATMILATLVLLLYIGLRPLLVADKARAGRGLAAGLAVVWIVACYLPFHLRLFPGTPLVDGAQLTATGTGLPLAIPADGHRAIDLLLEGKLAPSPTGGAALPVHFQLTLEDEQGTKRLLDGTFEDKLGTRRLGRRGTAVVHQTHTSELRVVDNPGRHGLRLTALELEPPSSQPITVTVYAHPLPGPILLGLATAALLGVVIAFDRLGPVMEADGALTLSTAAVLGAAMIFWTSNAVHPDVSTLVGSAIFGGPLGFAVGAVLWWVAKRTIGVAAR